MVMVVRYQDVLILNLWMTFLKMSIDQFSKPTMTLSTGLNLNYSMNDDEVAWLLSLTRNVGAGSLTWIVDAESRWTIDVGDDVLDVSPHMTEPQLPYHKCYQNSHFVPTKTDIESEYCEKE